MPEAVPRILGIDPGKTRVGLAITDGLGVTAQGLDTYVRGRGDFLARCSIKLSTAPAATSSRLSGSSAFRKDRQSENTSAPLVTG